MDGCERKREEMNLSLIKAQVYGLEEPWTKQASVEGLPCLIVGTIISWIKNQYVRMMV